MSEGGRYRASLSVPPVEGEDDRRNGFGTGGLLRGARGGLRNTANVVIWSLVASSSPAFSLGVGGVRA